MNNETLYEKFRIINNKAKAVAEGRGRKFDAVALAATSIKENWVELLNGQKLTIDELVVRVLRGEIFLERPSALNRYNFKRVEKYFPR